MKSYLARLVARVVPPPENQSVPPEPVSDPFADGADAGGDPSAAAPAVPNVPTQISRDDSPLRPRPPAQALPESAITEMSEVRPPSSNLKDQTSLPTTPEASAPPHLQPNPKGKSQDNATEAAAKEAVPLKPKDDDLLRVADRFMENLQTHPAQAPAAATTVNPIEVRLPLLPREPPWNKTQLYQTQRVDPVAPALHIGNLRVDIIESSAASVGPVRSSAPKFIVHNGARRSRSGATFRQRFGLRQL
jgi:hypothetical protein